MITQTLKTKVDTTNHRIFYSQNNSVDGTTLICIGGIHGNEPAGVQGLSNVIGDMVMNNIECKGNFYALLGNMNALKKSIRYKDYDLNRLWTKDEIEQLTDDDDYEFEEQREQKELYAIIKDICNSHTGRFVFVDLHTTSSPTIPFLTISDSINNRSLAKKFKLPIVLGIEEYLEGPLLSFINEFGHVAIGFEAGQHDDENSVKYCEAFIWLMLYKLGFIKKGVFEFQRHNSFLKVQSGFYEIIYRHSLNPTHQFKMRPGFDNFKSVVKHQSLAFNDMNEIKSPFNGLIFMPLYQKQGEDGFFIVRKLSQFWLNLSLMLRMLHCHKLLPLLPGISKHPAHEHGLIANRKIALFLTTKIFHLFGYRRKIVVEDKIHFMKRDRKTSAFI